jgi:hypothetical protein
MTASTENLVHSLYGIALYAPSSTQRAAALDRLEGIAHREGCGTVAAMLDTLRLDISPFFSSLAAVRREG